MSNLILGWRNLDESLNGKSEDWVTRNLEIYKASAS